ncbi:hypothetical protein LaLC_55840 [Bacillus anthracis]|nr:hypothetical protein BACI_pCIXO101290 [Bacillus cereus biovar anthracis str. CI]AFH86998.1 Transposase [Bacillus anthracis str. H9401]EJT17100.1 transposase [Bacillus anthracis str. UR-1]BAR79100.1 transposase orfB, IS150-related protein [Bacillus anthracis]GAO62594.1 transposase orfB, IS150-related protein [Bacillus anthracis]
MVLHKLCSCKGNYYDNAAIENSNGIMKFKFLNRNEFKNIEYFKYELVKYTAYYNHTRINRNKKS